MNKDIILGQDVRDSIKEGVRKLSEAVLCTMGPNGSTVIVADGDKPYITKDGVSVSNSVVLLDPIENIAATLLKEVAKRTVDQAGDGTTTSICLANAFIAIGYNLIEAGVDYTDVKKALDEIERGVLLELNNIATPMEEKDIINVATISANNDVVIGELIKKAYNHSKIVKVEESNNTEDVLETVKGMKVLGSYYDKAFINNFKKQSIDYANVELLIVKGKIDNIGQLKLFLEGKKTKPVLIIADDYAPSVVSILKDNFNRGALEIGLLKSPGFAQHRKDLIEDIIVYTRGRTTSSGNIYAANVNGITATKDGIIITQNEPGGSEEVLKLKDMLLVEKEGYSKELLEQRIENLEGTLSIIKVGGNSELEMKERKDRIDDSVLAVKCALEEGVIKGGGFALKNIWDKLLYSKTPILELSVALLAPYETIGVKKISNKILDPVKVTRCAFQNAISVAKTILNTEAIVIGRWN